MCCKWHCQGPAWGHCVFCRFLLSQAMSNLFMPEWLFLELAPRMPAQDQGPGCLCQWPWLCCLECEGSFMHAAPSVREVSAFSDETGRVQGGMAVDHLCFFKHRLQCPHLFPKCRGSPPGPGSLGDSPLPQGQTGSCAHTHTHTHTPSCKSVLPTLCSEDGSQHPWPCQSPSAEAGCVF